MEAMLDMDYASSIVSINKSDLSKDLRQHCKNADVGKGANMVWGKTWHSKHVSFPIFEMIDHLAELAQFVTLLKVLDHLVRSLKTCTAPVKEEVEGNAPAANAQPAHKKRKVSTRSKKNVKQTFYGAPSKMNDRSPSSSKTVKTVPFTGIVRKSWHKEIDPKSLLCLRENYGWWDEFEAKIQDGDISSDDQVYLAELDSNSEDDG